jgi:hypothetical protein
MGILTKNYNFANPLLYTYDSDKITHDGVGFLLKDQRPANAVIGATYTSVIDTSWPVITGVGTGSPAIVANKLDLKGDTVKYVDYDISSYTSIKQKGAIKVKFTPNYSGAPTFLKVIAEISRADNDRRNHIAIFHKDDGNFAIQIRDQNDVVIINVDLGIWNPTAGTTYEIEFNYDIDFGVHRLFIDGVQFGATQAGTGIRDTSALLRVGSSYTGAARSDNELEDLVLFDEVQHTANYTPGYTLSETIYPTDNPIIEPLSNVTMDSLLSFTTTEIKTGNDEIKYINKKADTWKYYSSGWVDTDESYSQSNAQSEVNTNASTLIDDEEAYNFRAFMHSDDGTTTPKITNVQIQYNLIVLTVYSNTYVTLSQANDYLTSKYGASGWLSLSITIRKQLLISAYTWLVSEGLSKTSTAELVQWAQMELAWWIYNYISEYEDREALIAGGVREFALSKWREKLEENGLPKRIFKLIADDINYGGYFPDYNRELEN